jgi:hypothetical protein
MIGRSVAAATGHRPARPCRSAQQDMAQQDMARQDMWGAV